MRRLLLIIAGAAVLAAAPPRVDRSTIRIPVWTDAGVPLKEDSLAAKVDGKPAEILRLQGPSEDLMLLLVLDLVADLNEIELAREALTAAVAEMPTNVYLGVLRAQDGLRVLVDPTDNREAIINAIQTFTVSGTPGLLETIETASELADSILAKAPVRIAVFYVTDSDIRDYREDFTNPVINYSDHRDLSRHFPEGLVRERISKLAGKLSSSLAPVFIVHLKYDTDRLNEAYQNGLMQLASTTGGTSVFCRLNAEIGTAIERTFRRIVSHYGLDLQVPDHSGNNVMISLESHGGNLSYRNRVRVK